MTDTHYKRNICATCGIEFQHKRKKKYCSNLCCWRAQHRKVGHVPRAQYEAARRNEAHWFTCEHCGKSAHRKMSGTNTGPNRFCSMSCKIDHAALLRQDVELEQDRQRAFKRLGRLLSRFAEARAKQEIHDKRAAQKCLICGKPCGYGGTKERVYCSRKCTRQSPTYKLFRSAYKAKRKAFLQGVDAEIFHAEEILERDGWRCQICGVSTPKNRRGTFHKNAPELDHIIPLSKGGPHTRANTQCTCRACNQWKSNRVIVGQIGLFAAA